MRFLSRDSTAGQMGLCSLCSSLAAAGLCWALSPATSCGMSPTGTALRVTSCEPGLPFPAWESLSRGSWALPALLQGLGILSRPRCGSGPPRCLHRAGVGPGLAGPQCRPWALLWFCSSSLLFEGFWADSLSCLKPSCSSHHVGNKKKSNPAQYWHQ